MLIGFLLSDGSIYFDKSKQTYCIQLTNKVDALLEKFKDLMQECFGLNNPSYNKCSNALSIRFFSKKVALELMKYSPTYRTLRFPTGIFPPAIIPVEILENPELLVPFLQAYFSCDGSVLLDKRTSHYRVEVACVHPLLRKQLSQALSSLEIRNRITLKGVVIGGKANVRLFADKIRFLDESIVCNSTSKYYGIAKNQVLAKILNSSDTQSNHPPAAVSLAR